MTLIELMVGAIIIVSGMLGVSVMLDGANQTTDANRMRITGTNLAREVLDASRSVDYDAIGPGTVGPALRARAGLAPTGTASGDTWNVRRRNVTFTITATPCTFDDPKDGLANPGATPPVNPPDNPCPAAAPVSFPAGRAPVESQPDDFRRVAVEVSWQRRGRHVYRATALIPNPTGGLGPRITCFARQGRCTPPLNADPGGAQVGPAFASQNNLPFAVETALNPTASAVNWKVDDGSAGGDAAGGTEAWNFNWQIGVVGTPNEVLDGIYSLSAQAFDNRGTPGDTRALTIGLNRSDPRTPTTVTGGINRRFGVAGVGVVELQWAANPERDIIGYYVERQTATERTQVCGSLADPLRSSQLSCIDTNPVGVATSDEYYVIAVDKVDINNPSSINRGGIAAVFLIPNPDDPPARPTGLTWDAATATLDWADNVETNVKYRVYKDGVQIADRVAQTGDSLWIDPDADGTTHQYWVSAINDELNESTLAGPVPVP